MDIPEAESPDNETSDWDWLLGFLGFAIGVIGGFLLFASTYPFNSSGPMPVWKASVLDGVVIAAVGTLAYVFRRRTYFLRGVLVSASLLFIVNGLCGVTW